MAKKGDLSLTNGEAVFLLLDVPEGTEIGIDYKSWNIGPNFKGIKGIAAGVHFIYYSACDGSIQSAPRRGFFHDVKAGDIIVRKWDKFEEGIKNQSQTTDDMERCKENMTEISHYLGNYPEDTYRTWVSLTSYLTAELISRLQPVDIEISSAPQLVSEGSDTQSRQKAAQIDSSEILFKNTESSCSVKSNVHSEMGDNHSEYKSDTTNNDTNNVLNKSDVTNCDDRTLTTTSRKFCVEDGLPDMKYVPGTELRFTPVPKTKYPPASTPDVKTKYSMDSSYVLECLFNEMRKRDITDVENALLGEIQFAFVCFLIGQVYDAFDQWKSLVLTVCTCEEAIRNYPKLFNDFISVIHYQIREVPKDFFVDIITQKNFLTTTLYEFFTNIESVGDEELQTRARKFKAHLTEKFKWDFTSEPSEYAPVVVETN